jgi:LmbE family N-acetylglucosaminyl deacetylase
LKVLAIVSHPDDEILGVGGTLLKHRDQFDEIYICVLTKAWTPDWSEVFIKKRLVEQNMIDEAFGTKKRFNLDFPTTKLNSVPAGEINKAVTRVINEVNPDVVYTHSEHDIHNDHKVTFQACMVALRPPKRARLICFETISETEWNNQSFIPNYWVDIKGHLDEKIRLFNIYDSEVDFYPNPRSPEGIRIHANKRGIDVCMEYAEAFMKVKEFWE